jgi:hypothetical protein
MKTETQTITPDLLARLAEGAREQGAHSGGQSKRARAAKGGRQLGKDGQVRVQTHPGQSTDAER